VCGTNIESTNTNTNPTLTLGPFSERLWGLPEGSAATAMLYGPGSTISGGGRIILIQCHGIKEGSQERSNRGRWSDTGIADLNFYAQSKEVTIEELLDRL